MYSSYDDLQHISSRRPPLRFDEYYRCFPLAKAPSPERPELNYGSKILLPPSALDKVSRMHVQWPLLMEVTNGAKGKHTHCGVLEFIAEEGRAYLPTWMMKTLELENGDMIQVRTTALALATLVKLQPQSTKFLDITDPRAVLEKTFRNFATLTKGDVFDFKYNDEIYEMAVLDVKPASNKMGVCMIETDVSVEFAPPVGYVEPTRPSGTSTPATNTKHSTVTVGHIQVQGVMAKTINYDAIKPSVLAAPKSRFVGEGKTISDKRKKKDDAPESENAPALQGARPQGPKPLRLPLNQIFLGYDYVPLKTKEQKAQEIEAAKKPYFKGQGQTIRDGAKKKASSDPSESSLAAKTESAEEQVKKPSKGYRLNGKPVE